MKLLYSVVLLVISHTALASSALLDFSNSMYSFTADFTQTVYDNDSVVLQENKGKVKLVRPGKFRWTYSEPFVQVIVADGLTLWVYDEDIAQVTRRPQADTLGSAPIGLLSGQRALESEFNVIDLGARDGLQWFQLEPLVQDTDFNRVFIALDANGLRAMELRDSFEQATQIRFTNFRKNVDIPAEEFTFTPPSGVDVVGEPGVAAPTENVLNTPTEVAAEALFTEPAATDPLLTSDPLLSNNEAPTADTGVTTTTNAETQNTSPSEPAAVPAPVPSSVEDVLLESSSELLAETPDDAPGLADGDNTETTTEGVVTFEVIETTEVPAE